MLLSITLKAQLNQIVTGTTQKLTYLSAINKSVIVGGLFDYVGKCNDNCGNLASISVPGPNGYALNFFRQNVNNIYCVSYSLGQTLLYFSSNNGANWVQKLDTIGDFTRYLSFYDSMSGVVSWENSLIETSNGGNSWNSISTPLIWPDAVSALGVYQDSMLCVGGEDGSFYLSRDRGQSWPYAWSFFNYHTVKDFSFLSKDTIFALSIKGGLAKTTNGGSSWTDLSVPIYSAYGLTFKNKQVGFAVGADVNGYGIIAKTTNMGTSWSAFPTQVYSTFFNIELVNDSIALISGSNGVLLTWNYKTTLITGDLEQEVNAPTKLYPNPTEGHIFIESIDEATMRIADLLGKEYGIYKLEQKTNEFDLTSMPKGVYLCRLEYSQKTVFYKLVLK